MKTIPGLDVVLNPLITSKNEQKKKNNPPQTITRWRRLSTPSAENAFVGVNESCNSTEAVLRHRLKQEEALLVEETERMLEYPRDSEERLEVQKKIQVRSSLIDAMKNTLGIHESVTLRESFIKIRRSTSEPYKKYWCVIHYPNIKVFNDEKDFYPIEYIQIDGTTKILTHDEFTFILKFDKKSIMFQVDTNEETEQWIKALSLATGISPSPSVEVKRKRRRSVTSAISISSSLAEVKVRSGSHIGGITPRKGCRIDAITPRKGSRIDSLTPRRKVKIATRYYPFTSSNCEDFEAIKLCFSETIETEYKDQKYFLTSGSFDDIIKWCIVQCQTKDSEDAATLFLCKHWICTTEEFNEKVITIWKDWESTGFPFGIPRNVMCERMANFATLYLDGPVANNKPWDKDQVKLLKIQEKNTRKQLRKQLVKIHPYFKKGIEDAKTNNRLTGAVSCEMLRHPAKSYLPTIAMEDEDELINHNHKVIAGQITLQQSEIFGNINVAEFMDKNWEKPEKSPGLQSLAGHCNKITSWVIQTILSGKDQKDQTNKYIKFIKIAHHLNSLRNYNSCVAVLGGIESAPISRLKRFKNIPDRHQAKLEKLKEIFSPFNSYSNYRALPTGPRCIPLMGIYLRDLTFSYDGNPIYLDEESKTIVNFDRMKLVANRVLEIISLEVTPYLFEINTVPKLKQLINNLTIVNPDELYEQSLKIQPLKSNKSPKQRIEELETEKKQMKADYQLRLEEIYEKLKSTESTFSSYKERKDSKAKSGDKAELAIIKEQIAEALALCKTPVTI